MSDETFRVKPGASVDVTLRQRERADDAPPPAQTARRRGVLPTDDESPRYVPRRNRLAIAFFDYETHQPLPDNCDDRFIDVVISGRSKDTILRLGAGGQRGNTREEIKQFDATYINYGDPIPALPRSPEWRDGIVRLRGQIKDVSIKTLLYYFNVNLNSAIITAEANRQSQLTTLPSMPTSRVEIYLCRQAWKLCVLRGREYRITYDPGPHREEDGSFYIPAPYYDYGHLGYGEVYGQSVLLGDILANRVEIANRDRWMADEDDRPLQTFQSIPRLRGNPGNLDFSHALQLAESDFAATYYLFEEMINQPGVKKYSTGMSQIGTTLRSWTELHSPHRAMLARVRINAKDYYIWSD